MILYDTVSPKYIVNTFKFDPGYKIYSEKYSFTIPDTIFLKLV